MERQEFLDKMQHNTPYALGFIVRNNLPKVNEALIVYGINKDPVSLDHAYAALLTLFNSGKTELLKKILNIVPVKADATNETAELVGIVLNEAKNNPAFRINFNRATPGTATSTEYVPEKITPDIPHF